MCGSQRCPLQYTLQYRSFFLSISRGEVAAHFRGYRLEKMSGTVTDNVKIHI